MFRIGLNPYGLAYAVGLQGAGTSRVNPVPIGVRAYFDLALELGARCLELHGPWLTSMSDDDLAWLRGEVSRHDMAPIVSHGLAHDPGETLEDVVRCVLAIGGRLIRLGLTPVLEGGRATCESWSAMRSHALRTLAAEAPRAADAGITIAIENHQDFGSEELVEMSEHAGDNVGVVMDTGNPFAVGEDPLAFARRVAHRLRHVHLKDYRAQFTREGYRLIRCAIGDGAVPFDEIAEVLAAHRPGVTASIEPGALEARHIRLFTPGWWRGYPPRDARELATAIGRLRRTQIPEDDRYQTPWEAGAAGPDIVAFELAEIRRSAENMRRFAASPLR